MNRKLPQKNPGIERPSPPPAPPSPPKKIIKVVIIKRKEKEVILNMSNITANGISTTTVPGTERYETFIRKVCGKTKKYCTYDFRDNDGELFSTVKPTLEQCRSARDEWVDRKI